MNYSTLVFRKDMTGVTDYVSCLKQTSGLMKAYLYSQRSVVNGETCLFYEDTWLSDKEVLNAFDKYFYRYEKYLSRGYEIQRVESNNGVFSLGSFSDDYENCELNCNDFNLYKHNSPKERFLLFDDSISVEVYDRGCILTDMKTNIRYLYALKDIDFLKRFKEFPFEMEIVAKINCGLLEKKEKYEVLDGLSINRLPGNLVKISDNQRRLLQYSRGYMIHGHLDSGRCKFLPKIWYKGRCYFGRPCDNEPEAICEAYMLEHGIAGDDEQYLFNPIFSHRLHQDSLEKYVRGEITELGLQRDILDGLVHNPFLILRYNLIDLCRKFCIYIYPFELDAEGFMINENGTRYSELAERAMNGALSKKEMYLQHLL